MSVSTMAPPTDGAADKGEEKKGGGKKKLVLILLVVVVVAAAAWFFLLRGGGSEEVEAVPGEVLTLEPVQINLADGHYLRLGLSLQLTETAEEADGSKALDAAIDIFSGRKQAELTKTAGRQKLKKELVDHLEEAYHGEVMDVYFTEFVTQ